MMVEISYIYTIYMYTLFLLVQFKLICLFVNNLHTEAYQICVTLIAVSVIIN